MADLKFPMPEGFTLPEGGDKGTFEVLATLEVEGDGQLCLKAIDGIPVGEYSEKESEPEEAEYAEATNPDTGDFEKAVALGMGR
jgi:hypothetical protein